MDQNIQNILQGIMLNVKALLLCTEYTFNGRYDKAKSTTRKPNPAASAAANKVQASVTAPKGAKPKVGGPR